MGKEGGISGWRLRESFALRWLVAVSAALVAASVVSFAVLSAQLEDDLVAHAARLVEADVNVLEQRLALEDSPGAEREVLKRRIGEMVLAGHITYVGVFHADDGLLFASGPGPRHLPSDTVEAVLAGGRVVYEEEQEEGEAGEGRYEFVAPLETSAGTVLLEIDQRTELVGAVTGRLRTTTWVAGAAVVLVAVPLSYLFGGASLGRRHREAHRLAETDELTGLSGRRGFRPSLEAALNGRGPGVGPAEGVSLALVDLDDFKTVNDRLGHSYGDRVLVTVARAFDELRPGDHAFRLGGDEFGIVLPGTDDEAAVTVVERVRAALQQASVGVSFSAGVASSPRAAPLSMQELWERADAALYEAKRRGRARTAAFSGLGSGLVIAPDKLDALTELDSWADRVSVAFQPIWDLRTGTTLGHEALLRLPEDLPFDGPADAFAVAARLGRAAALDEVARQAAVAAVARLGWDDGLLFLNLHPDAVADLDLAKLVAEVTAAGLTPSSVVLEVTEQAQLSDREDVRVLKQAQASGFKIALDDLGQGNAGLQAMSRVRFDVIKLDRVVVARLGIDPAADATMAAAASFVDGTGGLLIAEGIEDAVHLDGVLRNLEPRELVAPVLAGQGYLLGRPRATPRQEGEQLDVVSLAGVDARWAGRPRA